HHERHPEPLQVVRLGRGRAGDRRGAAEPRRLLQYRPRTSQLLRPRQAAVPHPDRLRGDEGRRARAGLLEHGRRRPGDVPYPVAHQRARLRHGDPGSHRAAALRGGAARSGRRRGSSADREPGPRGHPRGARAPGPQRHAGLRLLHAHGPRPRHHPDQRHPARRRGSPRRRRRDRLLMVSRRVRSLLAGLAAAGLLVGPAGGRAEEWGGIEPGLTTIDQVRARYGAPSKETRAKVEGHDTIQWVFEDARAPGGIQSLTVDYGLLTPQGYKQTVVRAFRIVPKPKIFGKNTVAQAWGPPDAIGKQNEQETFFYKSGLVVIFTKEGDDTVLMTFTPPQPDAPAPAAPRR